MDSPNRRTNANGGVGFEYSDNVLAVGARTAVLEDVADRSEVLRTYFDLVAEQRSAPLASRIDLRDRDLLSLSSILDLAPVDLERYIDRELARFTEATDSAHAVARATAGSTTIRRLRVGLLMLGAALVAAVGATVVAHATASAQPAPPVPVATPATVAGGGTVRVEPDPNGTGTFVIVDSPPVPRQRTVQRSAALSRSIASRSGPVKV
jgi:hypothetical protein